MLTLRLATVSDIPTLANLYRQTVLTHAPQYYSPAQTKVWASFALDNDHFRKFILEPTTYVAETESGIVGFAGIAASGHVASAYVRHDALSQGIGSALMEALLKHAAQQGMQRLYGEASEFSLGLFEKFGFSRYAAEVVERQGVEFTRYLVERSLENAISH